MKKLLTLIFLLTTLCGFAQTVYTVKPNVTDATITIFTDRPHYCIYPIAPIGKLLVFLPGTNGKPKGSSIYMNECSKEGYHILGLMYPNSSDAFPYFNSTFINTYGREVWYGINYSSGIYMSRSNCIENRIIKLLQYLDNKYPMQGWNQFYNADGTIRYDKISFSGHSQGGNYAALVGKWELTDRIIMVSSPRYEPNMNYGTGFSTPLSEFRCFNHADDDFSGGITQQDVLQGMGIDDAPVDVSNPESEWNSRFLVTSIATTDEHKCTLNNSGTPIINGKPLFAPVWKNQLTQ